MSKTRKSPNIPAKNIPVSLRGDCWQGEDNEFWTVASQPRGFTWVRARESQEVECETFHMKDEVEQLARNKDKEGPAKVLKGRPEAKQKKKENAVAIAAPNIPQPNILMKRMSSRMLVAAETIMEIMECLVLSSARMTLLPIMLRAWNGTAMSMGKKNS